MFVNDTARWGEQTFPSTFPGLVRSVGIFDVKRTIERIESAYRIVFGAIDRARATAGPEDRNGLARFIAGADLVVPEVVKSAFETRASLAGFFTTAAGIRKENLRRHGEDGRVGEAVQERPQKSPVDDHVIVEKNNDFSLDGSNPAV